MSYTFASRENIYIFRMKSLTLMKSLTSLVNDDGALHLMKRRRPHFSCSPIFISSLAKRLHSFISPLGRLHFRRVTAMLQKTSLSTRAETAIIVVFIINILLLKTAVTVFKPLPLFSVKYYYTFFLFLPGTRQAQSPMEESASSITQRAIWLLSPVWGEVGSSCSFACAS